MASTVSTIENRVAQTVNTREKPNNMVAWTVSTIENRVAQTVNIHEKANNMVAYEQLAPLKIGWLKQLTSVKIKA